MQPSLSGPTICTTVRMEGHSCLSRKEGRLRFVKQVLFNRELKQRRFWAADVNRKFMFLLLARFHARPMSYKALILTFWMERVKYASKRRSLDFRLTSLAQKRLCLSSLKKTHQQQFLERRNCKNCALPWIYLNLTKLHCNWHPQRISSFESFGLHTMFLFTTNTPTFTFCPSQPTLACVAHATASPRKQFQFVICHN